MVTAMIYDTLKLAEQLETEAGFDAPRARAMARILAENAGGNLATREDLLVAKGELQAEIQHLGTGLRDEINAVSAGLRDEIQRVSSGLTGEIHGVDTRLRTTSRAFAATSACSTGSPGRPSRAWLAS